MVIPEFLVTLIGGGFVGYLAKYWLDRRMQIVSEIMAQKRDVYAQTATSMRIFIAGSAAATPQQECFLADYSKLWLWGSDEVIRSLNEFIDLNRMGPDPIADDRQLRLRVSYRATMSRMRRDLRHTDLNDNDFRFVNF
jgi:hypothetical protein